MQKRHFEALALALKSVTPLARDGEKAMRAWLRSVYAIAGVCSQSNPRFDRKRFIAACEGEVQPCRP